MKVKVQISYYEEEEITTEINFETESNHPKDDDDTLDVYLKFGKYHYGD